MKISVYGSGYVGLVAACCFAESGNDVICVDIDGDRVNRLQKGEIPFFEPGLAELSQKNRRIGRLRFSTEPAKAVRDSLFHFIAVGTPPNDNGSADLSQVFSVAQTIAEHMEGYKIVVDKSTVPVGTADKVREIIKDELKRRGKNHPFAVVSNPEFLREGSAINDFFQPDRVIIGSDRPSALESLEELYQPFLDNQEKLIKMDTRSAEMTKYAANAFLAAKISFINEMANLCDKLGSNIDRVKKGMGTDIRIGNHFLNPGIGYGGSCFPKDVQALIATGKDCGAKVPLLNAVEEVNRFQKGILFEKIHRHFDSNLSEKRFAVWGLAFKPQTDDMREAPSLNTLRSLLDAGAGVVAYDPAASENALKLLGHPNISFKNRPYDVLEEADALIIFTEWQEFKRPDFEMMKKKLNAPLIFDGRNVYDLDRMKTRGFHYISVGRPEIRIGA